MGKMSEQLKQQVTHLFGSREAMKESSLSYVMSHEEAVIQLVRICSRVGTPVSLIQVRNDNLEQFDRADSRLLEYPKGCS